MEPPVKMEAHGATAVSETGSASETGVIGHRSPATRPRLPTVKDPFRLGFRYQVATTPDGREDLEQVPLTPEDLVYPQEGDHESQGLPHFSFLHPQADAMRRYLEKRPGLVVTSDVTLVLRHDGKNCAPDVAVIKGNFDASKIKGAVNLRKVSGRLLFVLEAVSTSDKAIENKDLKKNKERYAKEKVPEYVTVYPQTGRKVSKLVGWRLNPATSPPYVEITPDAQGRVYSEQIDVLFSIDPETEELVAVDASTGQRLRISDEEEAGRVEAERRLAEESAARCKAEAEIERLKAQLRRQPSGL